MILSSIITTTIKKFKAYIPVITLKKRRLSSTKFCSNSNKVIEDIQRLKIENYKIKKNFVKALKIKNNCINRISTLKEEITELQKAESSYMHVKNVQKIRHFVSLFLLKEDNLRDKISLIIKKQLANFISLFLISKQKNLTKKMNFFFKVEKKSQSSYYESFLEKRKSFVFDISLKNLKQFYYFFENIPNYILKYSLICKGSRYKNKLDIIEKENLILLEYENILLVQKKNLELTNFNLINTLIDGYVTNFKLEGPCIEKHPIFAPIFFNFVVIVLANCSLDRLETIFYNFISNIVSYFLRKLRKIFLFFMFIIILIISFF